MPFGSFGNMFIIWYKKVGTKILIFVRSFGVSWYKRVVGYFSLWYGTS